LKDNTMPTYLTPEASAVLWNALAASWAGVDDAAHDVSHIRRVRATALRLFKEEGELGDGAALEAAAILHDLVHVEKSDPRRSQASRMAAEAAAPILERAGFTPAQIATAQHAIEAHSWSAGIPPQTLEARLLRDADRLDAIGAIGVARCLAVSGRLGQQLHHPDDPHATGRALDDTRYCYDHFHTKLYGLADGLSTPSAIAEGAKRVARMRAFWDNLFDESQGL
jgi:uncharacterized protein